MSDWHVARSTKDHPTHGARSVSTSLAAMLIALIEAAEHHSQWRTFDARTLRAAAAFVAELRGEGK